MKLLNGPSHHIVEAGQKAIATAADVVDPVDRARCLEQAMASIGPVQTQLREARAAALQAAVADRSVSTVAAELGISRQRLHQILREA